MRITECVHDLVVMRMLSVLRPIHNRHSAAANYLSDAITIAESRDEPFIHGGHGAGRPPFGPVNPRPSSPAFRTIAAKRGLRLTGSYSRS